MAARPANAQVYSDITRAQTLFAIEGTLKVVRPVGDREEPVVRHGPGEFTGEINMLSARRSLLRGRAVDDATVIMIDRERLRESCNAPCPEVRAVTRGGGPGPPHPG